MKMLLPSTVHGLGKNRGSGPASQVRNLDLKIVGPDLRLTRHVANQNELCNTSSAVVADVWRSPSTDTVDVEENETRRLSQQFM